MTTLKDHKAAIQAALELRHPQATSQETLALKVLLLAIQVARGHRDHRRATQVVQDHKDLQADTQAPRGHQGAQEDIQGLQDPLLVTQEALDHKDLHLLTQEVRDKVLPLATQAARVLRDLPLATQAVRDLKVLPLAIQVPQVLKVQHLHTLAAQDKPVPHTRAAQDPLATQVLPALKVLRHRTPVRKDRTIQDPKVEVKGTLQASPVDPAFPRGPLDDRRATLASPHSNQTENTSHQEIEQRP